MRVMDQEKPKNGIKKVGQALKTLFKRPPILGEKRASFKNLIRRK